MLVAVVTVLADLVAHQELVAHLNLQLDEVELEEAQAVLEAEGAGSDEV
jgi:hypothetical protein